MKKAPNQKEMFQINNYQSIVFSHYCFPGMVGETHTMTDAVMIDFNEDQIYSIDYAELVKLSPEINEDDREEYDQSCWLMSEQGIDQAAEDSTADAIRRVI